MQDKLLVSFLDFPLFFVLWHGRVLAFKFFQRKATKVKLLHNTHRSIWKGKKIFLGYAVESLEGSLID